VLLLVYGQFCANQFNIFYWHHKPFLEDQFIQGKKTLDRLSLTRFL